MVTEKIDIDLGNVKLRNRVLITLSSMLAFAALVAALFNIFAAGQNVNLVIVAEFITFFIFAYVAVNTTKGHKKPWFATLVIYTFSGLISFALFSFPAGSSIIQWWYVIPILSLFLLSKGHGIVVSLLMLAVAIYVHISNNINVFEKPWYLGMVNLTLPYLIALLLANVYEKVRKQNEQELTEFALTDPLTKSYNRLALKSIFPRLQQAEQDYSMLLLDIDHFKQINDNFGHEAGDHVLLELSNLFVDELAQDRVFRIGGEEFLLILEGKNEESLVRAESMRAKVEKQDFFYQGQRIYLTMSSGLVSDIGSQSLQDMQKQADSLLYQAKQRGRNRVAYID